MLAISAREAIRDAISACTGRPGEIPLASPATGEAVFRAIHAMAPPPDPEKRQTF
jgi:xanthine dehydrogenase molybdopterin-binding subunit B